MCKYCDNWKERYLLNPKFHFNAYIEGKESDDFITEDDCFIINFGAIATLILIRNCECESTEIKYCPFCDKKLIYESSKDSEIW